VRIEYLTCNHRAIPFIFIEKVLIKKEIAIIKSHAPKETPWKAGNHSVGESFSKPLEEL
jgi:hypothetical protein